MFVTDIMAIVMSIPATFFDAFNGIRADLVEKISPSPRFWNMMIDRELLTPYHVEKLKVFASTLYFKWFGV